MRPLFRQFLCLVFVVGISGNGLAQSSCQLDELRWLVGQWQMDSEQGQVFESWQQVSPLSFEGRGWRVQHHQVTASEALRLVQMQDQVFYLAKVTENPMPVAFLLVACDETMAVFENPQHDFPQRLTYRQRENSQLQVRVEDLDGAGFELLLQHQGPTD